jgi:hypothetical protein
MIELFFSLSGNENDITVLSLSGNQNVRNCFVFVRKSEPAGLV